MTLQEDPHRMVTDKEWSLLQLTTVLYYLHETNPDNGLVRDKTDPAAPVSIAAVGMALATIPVIVEHGVDEAVTLPLRHRLEIRLVEIDQADIFFHRGSSMR